MNKYILSCLLITITMPSHAQESAVLYARCLGAYTGIVSVLEKYSGHSKAQQEQINDVKAKQNLMLNKLKTFNLSSAQTDKLFDEAGALIGNDATTYAKLCDQAMGFKSSF